MRVDFLDDVGVLNNQLERDHVSGGVNTLVGAGTSDECRLLGIIGVGFGYGSSLDKGREQIAFDRLFGCVDLHALVASTAVSDQDGDLALRLALFCGDLILGEGCREDRVFRARLLLFFVVASSAVWLLSSEVMLARRRVHAKHQQYLRPRVPAHISLLTTATKFESVVLESLALAVAVGLALGFSTALDCGCGGRIVHNRRRSRLNLSRVCHGVDNDMVKMVDMLSILFATALARHTRSTFSTFSALVQGPPTCNEFDHLFVYEHQ